MKVIQSARRYRLVLALAGLGLLAVLLHGLVESYLAAPAAQALWWLRLQYLRLPQNGIWMIFLLLAYLLFHASLLRPLSSQPWQWEEAVLSPERPLKRLVQLVERSGSAYARRRLCQTVSELAVAALAERTGRSPHQVKAEILQRRLGLPEEVASYISEGLQFGVSALPGSAWGIYPRSRVDERLYKTLEFLENEEWMERIDGS